LLLFLQGGNLVGCDPEGFGEFDTEDDFVAVDAETHGPVEGGAGYDFKFSFGNKV
jgi:hypothetical protein